MQQHSRMLNYISFIYYLFNNILNFDVLLTVHLSIFISVINLLDAQNLFHNKFYFMSLHVSSTRANHKEVKIALNSMWCHHTYRWPSRARDTIISPTGGLLVHKTATYRCDDIRGYVMQFWPPDDEHMCSKHVEAWNKTYFETNFEHQVG